MWRGRACSLDEQPNRAVTKWVLAIRVTFGGDRERRYWVDPLALYPEQLAGGGGPRAPPRAAGVARSKASPIRAAASTTCSLLSSTSISCFERSAVAIDSGDAVPDASSSPSAVATATGTSSGSDSGASSMTQTPSANLGSRCRAASKPSRVLPIAPAPGRGTRRWEALRSTISTTSASRPISSETGSGRFVGRRDGGDGG